MATKSGPCGRCVGLTRGETARQSSAECGFTTPRFARSWSTTHAVCKAVSTSVGRWSLDHIGRGGRAPARGRAGGPGTTDCRDGYDLPCTRDGCGDMRAFTHMSALDSGAGGPVTGREGDVVRSWVLSVRFAAHTTPPLENHRIKRP
eukprot:4197037-Prymnesium_polylepis.2